MLLQCVCVYDRKVEDYSPMISFKHNGDALRWFEECSKDPKQNIGRYPSDFSLIHVGDFDTSSAVFTDRGMTTLAHADSFASIASLVPISSK